MPRQGIPLAGTHPRNRYSCRALTVALVFSASAFPARSTRRVSDTFLTYFSSYNSQQPLAMKKDIHPDYKKLTVQLADGTKFETRSTMNSDVHKSEVDSTNHPFYTGRRQYVDTAGRVEKFRRRYGAKEDAQEEEKA